ncbi:hypothetical protein FRC06_009730 [Ceratobasidium sp. 370]|nr:hypothetical protein FRC06_009730 [Ceratobasidium sp. 370]
MEFVWILKKLLALSVTTEQVKEVRQRIIRYVEQFEEYYYQYNPDRLATCKLTLHALLHIADDVVRCGPVWASWSFLMERYCAFAVDAALSLVNPYKSITNRIVGIAQLAALARQHRKVKRALRMGSGTPGDTSSMEHEYPEYDPQRRRLAGYFSSQLGSMGTFNQWFSLLPRYCTSYSKVRVRDGGDYIRSTIAASSASSVQWQDASFVRYVYWRDKYENQRHRRPEMEKKTEYGRLECILVLELAPNPVLGIKRKVTKILADLTPCVCVGEDATIEPVTYRQFQPRRILDIQAVENVVGRVLSRGDWYIIDRSVDGARTTFVDDLDD